MKAKWRGKDLEAVLKQPGLTTSRIGQDSVYTPPFNVPKTVTPGDTQQSWLAPTLDLRKAPDIDR